MSRSESIDFCSGDIQMLLYVLVTPTRSVYNSTFFFVQSIKELPGSVSVPSTSDFSTPAPLSNIPGSENEFKQDQRPLAWVRVILNISFFVPSSAPKS